MVDNGIDYFSDFLRLEEDYWANRIKKGIC